ncbi:flavo protein-like protein, partial [Blyttiomyces helicus]
MSKPVVSVIIYSLYGHIKTLADAIVRGVEAGGATAKLVRVPETLPDDVIAKMHGAKFEDIPLATLDDLTGADGYLFGIPTRFGTAPAQVKTFWDSTGKLWATGALAGKYAGVFTSTGGQHAGTETTILTFLPNLAHHGIIFVPL